MRGRGKWPLNAQGQRSRRVNGSGTDEQQRPVRITPAVRGSTAIGRTRMTIGCPECGTLERVPPLEPRALARCQVCHYPLERRSGRSISAALACATTTFALLLPANLAPIMTVRLLGVERSSVLSSGILTIWRDGWVILVLLLGIFGIVLPFVRFGALMVVLAAVPIDDVDAASKLGSGLRAACPDQPHTASDAQCRSHGARRCSASRCAQPRTWRARRPHRGADQRTLTHFHRADPGHRRTRARDPASHC